MLEEAFEYLLGDKRLPARYFDHGLAGDWKDHRNCHIRPDLILVYRELDGDILELTRLAQRTEL